MLSEKANTGAGFYLNQAEATPESTENGDQLIRQVDSGVASV